LWQVAGLEDETTVRTSQRTSRLVSGLALLCLLSTLLPVQARSQKSELELVIIAGRHGVRSPTKHNPSMSQYAADRWPAWSVPPAYLTAHGKKLMELLGVYYRAYYAERGILPEVGCPPLHEVWFRADNMQRTIQSARGLATGLSPGCGIKVHSLPSGQADPLFHPFTAKVGIPDSAKTVDAILGRIGSNPSGLVNVCRPALDALQSVLRCCSTNLCESELHRSKCTLADLPQSVSPGSSHGRIKLNGPISLGSTAAEDLLLEYAEDMPMHDVGWGRVTPQSLLEILQIHALNSDLVQRTPYLARTRGSNLVSHILWTMQQAATRKTVPGAIGDREGKLVALEGHDTNIANVGGMLHLSWLLPGFQMNESPPGGALVFELWRRVRSNSYFVRAYYVSQTLEQMRNLRPLSLKSPPSRVGIFIPGCSTSGPGYECPLGKFREVVMRAVVPQFVARAP
jgi:4-phytase / acid phosphatase